MVIIEKPVKVGPGKTIIRRITLVPGLTPGPTARVVPPVSKPRKMGGGPAPTPTTQPKTQAERVEEKVVGEPVKEFGTPEMKREAEVRQKLIKTGFVPEEYYKQALPRPEPEYVSAKPGEVRIAKRDVRPAGVTPSLLAIGTRTQAIGEPEKYPTRPETKTVSGVIFPTPIPHEELVGEPGFYQVPLKLIHPYFPTSPKQVEQFGRFAISGFVTAPTSLITEPIRHFEGVRERGIFGHVKKSVDDLRVGFTTYPEATVGQIAGRVAFFGAMKRMARPDPKYEVTYVKRTEELAGVGRAKKEGLIGYQKKPVTYTLTQKTKPEIKPVTKVVQQQAWVYGEKGMTIRKLPGPLTETYVKTDWLAKPDWKFQKVGLSAVESGKLWLGGRLTTPIKDVGAGKIIQYVGKGPFPKTPYEFGTITDVVAVASKTIKQTSPTIPPIVSPVDVTKQDVLSEKTIKDVVKFEDKPISYKEVTRGFPSLGPAFPHELTISRAWAGQDMAKKTSQNIGEMLKTSPKFKTNYKQSVGKITMPKFKPMKMEKVRTPIKRVSPLQIRMRGLGLRQPTKTRYGRMSEVIPFTPSGFTPITFPDFTWKPTKRKIRKVVPKKHKRRKYKYQISPGAWVTKKEWKKFPKRLSGLEIRYYKKGMRRVRI